uniref:tRNA-dihydrouridine synthase n=1 Tax=Solanum tuberosum TaxID=4113 RepID=M1CC15_SOLTU
MATKTINLNTEDIEDDCLCSEITTTCSIPLEQKDVEETQSLALNRPNGYLKGESRIERAWSHWKKLGEPKLIVAPMVDNSELPFRLLCRKYGAEAAYTPMLHSRLFNEDEKYRAMEFSTCKVSICL